MEEGCCKNETTHLVFQKDFTFHQLIKDCQAPVLDLAIFDFTYSIFDFNRAEGEFISVNKDLPPPNLVQQDIVSCSVLRI
jgi:hypothetical protein